MSGEILFYNGTVRTVAGQSTAQALLVRDGLIAAVGALEDVRAAATAAAEPVDLAGGALLPGFIDGHSHLSGMASALMGVRLNGVHSQAALAEAIRSHIERNRIPAGEWVQASGYDHNQFPDRAHPTTALLDAAAPDNPVLVSHISGHAGVFNSAALRALGLPADTGYREEGDFIPLTKRLPMPTVEAFSRAMHAAQKQYASYGITTVQDGMLTAELLPYYRHWTANATFFLDVVGYPDPAGWDAWAREFLSHSYRAHFRLGGAKIFLDGSPQNRTAWLRRPYLPLAGAAADWCGTPTMTPEAVRAAVFETLGAGRQLLAHVNGDGAAECLLEALAQAQAAGIDTAAARPVLIHAQLMGRDQLPLAAQVGACISFFAAHIWQWGDIHVQNLGLERAAYLSPAGSAAALGVPFTFHQDSPVLPPDMLHTLRCAVCRRTSSGVSLGEDERLSLPRALQAITADAAAQYFEENSKGMLCPGMRADLVWLDADPAAVPPEQLSDIAVRATWKDGRCVWSEEEAR